MRSRPPARALFVLVLGAAVAAGCHRSPAPPRAPARPRHASPKGHPGRRAAPKAAAPAPSPVLLGVDASLRLTPGTVIATAGARKIHLAEVDQAAAGPLAAAVDRFTDQVEALRLSALKRHVDEGLLDAEAKRRHLAGRAALVKQIIARVPAPAKAEVARYAADVEALLAAQGAPADKRRYIIQQSLLVQDRRLAIDAVLRKLRAKAHVVIGIPLRRFHVDPIGPSAGPKDAAVTVVAFTDPTGVRCRALRPLLEAVRRTYGSRVRIVYRADPRAGHGSAEKVAEAAACAAAQGKFFRYRARVYASQGPGTSSALDPKALGALAAKVPGLDAHAFATCLASGRMKAKVAADVAAAKAAGVTEVPTLFVDGIRLVGLRPLAAIDGLIDGELTRDRKAKRRPAPVALATPVAGVDARFGVAPGTVVATSGGRTTTLAEVDRLAGRRLADLERAFVDEVEGIRRGAVKRLAGGGKAKVEDRLPGGVIRPPRH